jgi:hypothetical protein
MMMMMMIKHIRTRTIFSNHNLRKVLMAEGKPRKEILRKKTKK